MRYTVICEACTFKRRAENRKQAKRYQEQHETSPYGGGHTHYGKTRILFDVVTVGKGTTVGDSPKGER